MQHRLKARHETACNVVLVLFAIMTALALSGVFMHALSAHASQADMLVIDKSLQTSMPANAINGENSTENNDDGQCRENIGENDASGMVGDVTAADSSPSAESMAIANTVTDANANTSDAGLSFVPAESVEFSSMEENAVESMSVMTENGEVPDDEQITAADAARAMTPPLAFDAAPLSAKAGTIRVSSIGPGSGVHISAFDVRSTVDGTGPFDADDDSGNDSSESNGVCRSFDTVSYTLGYVTALDDTSAQVSSARLKLAVTIPCSPKEARVDESGMAWAEDTSVTYVYEDGTTSTTWDKTKTVTSQIWTGYRTLQGKSSDDRVPGAGQLSVSVRLLDATDGKTYQPHAELQVVGSEVKQDVDLTAVKASSALKLDLFYQMGATESSRNVTYIDPDGKGDASFSRLDTDPATRTLAGRCYASAVGLIIHDDSSAKGLRGCSLPEGPVTFDVQTNVTLDGSDSNTGKDYKYLLWDARADDANYIQSDSLYGRSMHYTSCQYAWEASIPYNSYGSATNPHACRTWQNRPVWSFKEDETTPGLLHVTVTPPASGWVDFDNLVFPRFHNWTSDATDTGTNTEFPDRQFLAVGILQHYAAFPRTADATHNIRINSHVVTDSFHATSEAGTEQTATKTTNWYKSIGASVTIYAPGTYTSWNYPGGQLVRWPSYWSAGDASIARGNNLQQSTTGSYDGTRNVIAFDCLTTIDTDNAVIINQNTNGDVSHVRVGNNGEQADQRYLYAAKPDGTGWKDLAEQRSAHITDLVYYKTYADLEASGKVCVGYLREVRNANIIAYRSMSLGGCKVKVTGEPGNVVAITHESDIWVTGQKAPGSRTDHQNTDGSYGLVHDGNVAGKLSAYDGYDEQPYKGNNIANYERAKYANGVKVGGHNGGNVSGNSVLILGDKASVTINVADTDDFGAAKKVYDLDAGERDVTISATPALASYAAGGETGDKNLTDDVTMTVTIPKGLTYETGTASKTPTSIVNNADGTTTLTFDYKNAPVGELIEAVTLKAYIGNPGAEDDAVNNQQFTVTAHVFSRMDPSNSGAHASTTSFRVVRLAALSISKRVSSETSNVNASFDWVLRVSNTSRTDTHHAALADVLPFDGDGRGTRIAGNAPVLTSVEIDLSHAPRTKSSMTRLSSVMSVVSANVSASWPQDVLSNRSTDGTLPSATTSWPLSAAVASGDVMTFDTSASNARGIYVALGDLCAHEYVTITLHMGYPHGGELNGSTMSNQFIQVSDDQPADVASNVVTHRAESVTISIRKVWADGDDESGRPAQGIVASVTGTDGSTRRVNLDKAGNWSAEMTLPAFDDSGERVTYSVAEEGQVPGYLPGIVTGDQLSGYVITNELDVVGMPLSGGHGLTGIFVAASCFVIIAAMVVVIRRQRHAMHGQGA